MYRLASQAECALQVRWLQQLAALPGVPEVPAFGGEADALLNGLADNFSVADAQEVKEVRLTARMELVLASTGWQSHAPRFKAQPSMPFGL